MSLDIKTLREKLNLTQHQLAEKTNIPRDRIAKWEQGKGSPKAEDYVILNNLWEEVPHETDVKSEEKPESETKGSYLEQRRAKKNARKIHMAPLMTVKAQAGYVRAVDQEKYMDTLEQYALPPGVDHRGANWMWWEIEGDSMETAFHNGDIILTSQVHPMDWENLRNFYVYVLVTEERVLIKRVMAKNALEWVLISENEDNYPQQLLPVEYVKQLWVFRRRLEATAPPTKKFEIKV